MSMVDLLLATRQVIQSHLGLDGQSRCDLVCDITEDGRPKPASGQVFYGIVGGSFSNQSTQALDEFYDLSVIITLKASLAPHDRLGEKLLLEKSTEANAGGIWQRVSRLRSLLHMNYNLLAIANELIGDEANGFVQPLRFSVANYLGVKGPEWFDAEGMNNPPSGVAVQLNFVRARRVQTIESMT